MPGSGGMRGRGAGGDHDPTRRIGLVADLDAVARDEAGFAECELDPELTEKLRGLVRADFRLHFAHGLEYFAEVDFPGCVDSELSQAGGIVF